jgi:D-alanine-D-alanine ligase
MVRENGELVVLEINTMPGMTDHSLFPIAALEAGMPMPVLVQKLAELVERDYKL